MNERDCYPQTAEGLLGSQLVNRSIQSRVVIAPFASGTCLLQALLPRDQVPDIPEIPLEKSSVRELVVFFSQHGTPREGWESLYPGGVCSVTYHFGRLSQEPL